MANLLRVLFYLNKATNRLEWNEEKLKKYQLKKLRHVINYAYEHVQFYRSKFRSVDLQPSDIRSLSDLSKLPITTKSELRQQSLENLVSNQYLHKRLRVVSTSGSTGNPLKVHMTGREDDWRKAIYMRANVCCGQKLRDKWMMITGPGHFSKLERLQQFFRIYSRICVSVFEDVDKQLLFARSLKPQILDGYSSAIVILARAMKNSGIEDVRPRIVFGNAEVITKASQKYIEDVFDAPYFDKRDGVIRAPVQRGPSS